MVVRKRAHRGAPSCKIAGALPSRARRAGPRHRGRAPTVLGRSASPRSSTARRSSRRRGADFIVESVADFLRPVRERRRVRRQRERARRAPCAYAAATVSCAIRASSASDPPRITRACPFLRGNGLRALALHRRRIHRVRQQHARGGSPTAGARLAPTSSSSRCSRPWHRSRNATTSPSAWRCSDARNATTSTSSKKWCRSSNPWHTRTSACSRTCSTCASWAIRPGSLPPRCRGSGSSSSRRNRTARCPGSPATISARTSPSSRARGYSGLVDVEGDGSAEELRNAFATVRAQARDAQAALHAA